MGNGNNGNADLCGFYGRFPPNPRRGSRLEVVKIGVHLGMFSPQPEPFGSS